MGEETGAPHMDLEGTVYHPGFGQLIQYRAFPLADDTDTQVSQTVHRMARNIRANAQADATQQAAKEIQASSGGDDCAATFWWVKDRVEFSRDEALAEPVRPLLDGDVVEVLIEPRHLLRMNRPLEDCDGFASLAPALLRAMGVKCNLVTVAADPRNPERYSHVYAACYPNGQRVALDVSHGKYPGWECTQAGPVWRMKEWPIDGWDCGALLMIGAVLWLAAITWRML